MKDMRCLTTRALRALALLSASTLLVECAMPPREAWQYIQTNGLVNFLVNSPHSHRSPPFRADTLRSSHYNRPTPNGMSLWGSGMPNRIHYSTSSTYPSQNRYINPAPRSEKNLSSRTPRSRPRSHKTPRIEPSETTPESAPSIVKNEPPLTNTAPKPASPKPATELPYGTPVPGRSNMVNSPYAGKTQLVDVSGMGPGQTVKCPYTGKLFKVPTGAQAENKAAPSAQTGQDTPGTPSPKESPKQP